MMVIITMICHPNGQFAVGKNMGGFNESMMFKTREEADACAMQLQAEAGGPDDAKIIVHDLPRAGGAEMITEPLGASSTV
jgi:hypothetical protein